MKTASKRKPVRAIQRSKTRQIKPVRQQAIVKAAPPTVSEVIEQVLIGGNLQSLTTEQRLEYYNAVCKSLGLNPLTRPFEYIAFEGKLQLYARKDCTEQLRKIHGIAIVESSATNEDGMYIVHVKAQDRTGRTDTGTGAVDLGNLKGKDRCNAVMKAETKAKRRATLSMAGLGFLDESELDGSASYGTLTPGGRVMTVESGEFDPAEQRYLEREKEAISKLTPAQQEIVKQRMAKCSQVTDPPAKEAGAPATEDTGAALPPSLGYLYHKESDTWEIRGSAELKKKHWDLLGPLYSPVSKTLVADAKALGVLISRFEDLKIPFKELNG